MCNKMNDFAEYILSEQDLSAKMEIVYYLSKKAKIFFDKSIIFKTELTRLFLDYMKIDVDKNEVLTAMLLCNCKKVDNPQNLDKVHTYAKEGAQYLKGLGFNSRFCKICEEINRYTNSSPREKESDILELIDQFGGMLLDRPERIGFKPDEAIVLLEYRNLKDKYNRYLSTFIEFVKMLEEIKMGETASMTALRKLVKIYNETGEVTQLITKIVYEFEPAIDCLMKEKLEGVACNMFRGQANRPLFSEETTRKIMSHMEKQKLENIT